MNFFEIKKKDNTLFINLCAYNNFINLNINNCLININSNNLLILFYLIKSIIFNNYICIVNEILKQFIAIKETIEFNKTNLYKIFIKNQFDKLEEIKI